MTSEEIEKLLQSPIFNFSLSSKELFHSNFIFWLCHCYPEQLGRLFSKELGLEDENNIISNIKREKQNLDLQFQIGNCLVVVENKVKSLANKNQLKEYSDPGYIKGDYSDKKFILLSLYKPDFIERGDLDTACWRYYSYSDLLDKFISKLIVENEYHKLIINDYTKLLIFLTDTLKTEALNVDILSISQSETSKALSSLRMSDIYQKIVFEKFKEKLERKVLATFDQVTNKNADIMLYSGLTNVQGLCGVRVKINNPFISDFYLGIQIQANQYRYYAECHSRKSVIELISIELCKSEYWFSFAHFKDKFKIYPINNSSKSEIRFNEFGKNNSEDKGVFKYRYAKLDNLVTNSDELVELIIADLKMLFDNESQVVRVINDKCSE